MWSAEAPANIALIKYMGKSEGNKPLNPSLSFTLDLFKTRVSLDLIESEADEWDSRCEFSQQDQKKFLKHLSYLKEHFGVDRHFRIYSKNGFPAHCGLASSASSFAALTKCASTALSEIKNQPVPDLLRQSLWSRHGSGSSCRSLFGPFAVWDEEGARQLETPVERFLHQVVVVDSSQKEVPSSEAHKRVLTSSLWAGRVERANERFKRISEILKHNTFRDEVTEDWRELFEISWAEFWDMHSLFETSNPSFGYMQSASLDVQQLVRKLWRETGDGPLLTMDAGPNVHLLYRPDQRLLMNDFARNNLNHYSVLGHDR